MSANLRVFEFALPARTNDAMRSYNAEHVAFKETLLNVAGGYTELAPADGVWRDNGRDYRDRMYCYRVALPAKSANALRNQLTARAFALFHDQIALFVAEVGTAKIISREEFGNAKHSRSKRAPAS